MKFFNILCLFSLICIGLIACKKDKSNTDLLTSGYWEVTQIDFEPNNVSQSTLDNLKASLLGEQIKFNVGGEFTSDGGFNDLDSTGDWTFSPDEKIIIFDGSVEWEIISLTEKTLKANSLLGYYGSQGELFGTITFTH